MVDENEWGEVKGIWGEVGDFLPPSRGYRDVP